MAALSKLDQAKLAGLQITFETCLKLDKTPDQALDVMKEQITQFENETGHKLRLNYVDGKHYFKSIDPSKDYLRIRNPNDESKVLRAKSLGIMIEIKIQKTDEYSHSNSDICDALIHLSERIKDATTELNSLQSSDVQTGPKTEEQSQEIAGNDEFSGENNCYEENGPNQNEDE